MAIRSSVRFRDTSALNHPTPGCKVCRASFSAEALNIHPIFIHLETRHGLSLSPWASNKDPRKNLTLDQGKFVRGSSVIASTRANMFYRLVSRTSMHSQKRKNANGTVSSQYISGRATMLASIDWTASNQIMSPTQR